MATVFKETLIDADENTYVDEYYVDSSVVAVKDGVNWSVHKYTLRGGLQEGVEVVEIDNGKLCFAVLPTRGMGIWKGQTGDLRLGWDSPVKDPVHPAFVRLEELGGIGWLKGFNEWIVRCGLNSMGAPGQDVIIDNNGNAAEVTLPLHGQIANIPARKVSIEITDTEIILRGEVLESMMFGPALLLQTEIRTAFGSNALTINDTVTNIGRNSTEHELLYHINYGSPLLEKGARLVAPIKIAAPRDPRAAEEMKQFDRYEAPIPGFVEQGYYFQLAGKRRTRETMVMLRNSKRNKGSVVRYNLKDFPCFTLWKNTVAEEDGYVTGLEPGTAYPNSRKFERSRKRVLTLNGGESRRTSIQVEALETARAVKSVATEIQSIQKSVNPKVHPQPISRFSDR